MLDFLEKQSDGILIFNEKGDLICSINPVKEYDTFIFSSDKFISNETYFVYMTDIDLQDEVLSFDVASNIDDLAEVTSFSFEDSVKVIYLN